MQLGLQASAAGLCRDLSERTGVDVQSWIARCRVIENVVGIHTERQFFGFGQPNRLLHVGVQVPVAWPFESSQTE